MATEAETSTTAVTRYSQSTPRRVCFSFAAYAKQVIAHLKKCKIQIAEGLTDEEFSSIQSTLRFTFPPDIRSILREGLPVGTGFPDWRSTSPQQLEILVNLPLMGLQKEIIKNKFWSSSWGEKPPDSKEALSMAKRLMKKAPRLVPIYRNFYIPSSPNLAGNPVFFVHGLEIYCSGCDIAGFFQNVEFSRRSAVTESSTVESPAWAAKSAKSIEFWSDLLESVSCEKNREAAKLNIFFEEMSRKLKEGGWREEEVGEMMMADNPIDGQDDLQKKRHMRLLSLKLLQAGWTPEDVAYSLGSPQDDRFSLLPSPVYEI